MSAFVVGKDHIDALVHAHNCYKIGGNYIASEELDALGEMLWAANEASVAYRYREVVDANREPYRYNFNARLLSPVEILKAVQCLEYQSCERDDWETSAAYRWAQRMKSEAIYRLPGYEDAAWEYRAPDLSAARERAALQAYRASHAAALPDGENGYNND